MSQLARAGWLLAMKAEPEICEELRRRPLPSIPSTKDVVAYAEYEERLLQVIHRATRKAKIE